MSKYKHHHQVKPLENNTSKNNNGNKYLATHDSFNDLQQNMKHAMISCTEFLKITALIRTPTENCSHAPWRFSINAPP